MRPLGAPRLSIPRGSVEVRVRGRVWSLFGDPQTGYRDLSPLPAMEPADTPITATTEERRRRAKAGIYSPYPFRVDGRRLPTCVACKNHGLAMLTRGHRSRCPYRACSCGPCSRHHAKNSKRLALKQAAFSRSSQSHSASPRRHTSPDSSCRDRPLVTLAPRPPPPPPRTRPAVTAPATAATSTLVTAAATSAPAAATTATVSTATAVTVSTAASSGSNAGQTSTPVTASAAPPASPSPAAASVDSNNNRREPAGGWWCRSLASKIVPLPCPSPATPDSAERRVTSTVTSAAADSPRSPPAAPPGTPVTPPASRGSLDDVLAAVSRCESRAAVAARRVSEPAGRYHPYLAPGGTPPPVWPQPWASDHSYWRTAAQQSFRSFSSWSSQGAVWNQISYGLTSSGDLGSPPQLAPGPAAPAHCQSRQARAASVGSAPVTEVTAAGRSESLPSSERTTGHPLPADPRRSDHHLPPTDTSRNLYNWLSKQIDVEQRPGEEGALCRAPARPAAEPAPPLRLLYVPSLPQTPFSQLLRQLAEQPPPAAGSPPRQLPPFCTLCGSPEQAGRPQPVYDFDVVAAEERSPQTGGWAGLGGPGTAQAGLLQSPSGLQPTDWGGDGGTELLSPTRPWLAYQQYQHQYTQQYQQQQYTQQQYQQQQYTQQQQYVQQYQQLAGWTPDQLADWGPEQLSSWGAEQLEPRWPAAAGQAGPRDQLWTSPAELGGLPAAEDLSLAGAELSGPTDSGPTLTASSGLPTDGPGSRHPPPAARQPLAAAVEQPVEAGVGCPVEAAVEDHLSEISVGGPMDTAIGDPARAIQTPCLQGLLGAACEPAPPRHDWPAAETETDGGPALLCRPETALERPLIALSPGGTTEPLLRRTGDVTDRPLSVGAGVVEPAGEAEEPGEGQVVSRRTGDVTDRPLSAGAGVVEPAGGAEEPGEGQVVSRRTGDVTDRPLSEGAGVEDPAGETEEPGGGQVVSSGISEDSAEQTGAVAYPADVTEPMCDVLGQAVGDPGPVIGIGDHMSVAEQEASVPRQESDVSEQTRDATDEAADASELMPNIAEPATDMTEPKTEQSSSTAAGPPAECTDPETRASGEGTAESRTGGQDRTESQADQQGRTESQADGQNRTEIQTDEQEESRGDWRDGTETQAGGEDGREPQAVGRGGTESRAGGEDRTGAETDGEDRTETYAVPPADAERTEDIHDLGASSVEPQPLMPDLAPDCDDQAMMGTIDPAEDKAADLGA